MSLKPYPLPVNHIFNVFLKKVAYHSVLQKELCRTLWRRGVSAEGALGQTSHPKVCVSPPTGHSL